MLIDEIVAALEDGGERQKKVLKSARQYCSALAKEKYGARALALNVDFSVQDKVFSTTLSGSIEAVTTFEEGKPPLYTYGQKFSHKKQVTLLSLLSNEKLLLFLLEDMVSEVHAYFGIPQRKSFEAKLERFFSEKTMPKLTDLILEAGLVDKHEAALLERWKMLAPGEAEKAESFPVSTREQLLAFVDDIEGILRLEEGRYRETSFTKEE